MMQINPYELDELCPDEGMVWRVVMTEHGGGSQAIRVAKHEDHWPICHMECGSFLAFVDTEFKEDAVSEANRLRIEYKKKIPLGVFQGVQGTPPPTSPRGM